MGPDTWVERWCQGPETLEEAMIDKLSDVDQSWVDAALEGCTLMPTPRDPLLEERQKTHGSFETNARISQAIKTIIHKERNDGLVIISTVHLEALDMIALKLSRILSGQANYKDHWDDIAGYAKLGSEACE